MLQELYRSCHVGSSPTKRNGSQNQCFRNKMRSSHQGYRKIENAGTIKLLLLKYWLWLGNKLCNSKYIQFTVIEIIGGDCDPRGSWIRNNFYKKLFCVYPQNRFISDSLDYLWTTKIWLLRLYLNKIFV